MAFFFFFFLLDFMDELYNGIWLDCVRVCMLLFRHTAPMLSKHTTRPGAAQKSSYIISACPQTAALAKLAWFQDESWRYRPWYNFSRSKFGSYRVFRSKWSIGKPMCLHACRSWFSALIPGARAKKWAVVNAYLSLRNRPKPVHRELAHWHKALRSFTSYFQPVPLSQ